MRRKFETEFIFKQKYRKIFKRVALRKFSLTPELALNQHGEISRCDSKIWKPVYPAPHPVVSCGSNKLEGSNFALAEPLHSV